MVRVVSAGEAGLQSPCRIHPQASSKLLGFGSRYTPVWDANSHKSKALGCLQRPGAEQLAQADPQGRVPGLSSPPLASVAPVLPTSTLPSCCLTPGTPPCSHTLATWESPAHGQGAAGGSVPRHVPPRCCFPVLLLQRPRARSQERNFCACPSAALHSPARAQRAARGNHTLPKQTQ